MTVRDEDVAQLTVLLSPERLGALTQLTGNAKAAIELHQETLRLGASLMNVIASIEIALRNAVCESLGQHFGVGGWLIQPPAPFQWKEPERKKIVIALDSARRAEYSKMTQAEKHALDALAFPNGRPAYLSHLTRAKARRAQIAVTDGKVIAEITLYIWKRLYGPDYEHSLWRPALKKTFPNKKVKRSQVADHLETIYQARNRLAHHEPVLHKRFSGTITSIDFIIQHLGAAAPSPNTPLALLVEGDIINLNKQADELHNRLNAFRVLP